ncbi:hypothetical protein [Soonwooa sp.]|uniref:hypothetical protein n=1 Tax=Soonwooa sp. TaxID=1938592 RepID=UPI0026052FCB|nr:hypothetical protein [Soonwooa sp.]
MKKLLGIVLMIIGFALVVCLKMGPAQETEFLFSYGEWPLIAVALVVLVSGIVIYNKNK